MVRDDLYITVPSFFRCPISLDVMKSPVSLCTGVTYDRTSIQRWLDSGNNTCPATMQVLQTKEFVPNRTLERLIEIWSDSVRHRVDSTESTSVPVPSKERVTELVGNLLEKKTEKKLLSISEISDFARESGENRHFLAKLHRFVPMLVDFLGSDSDNASEGIQFLEKVVRVLELVSSSISDREELTNLMVKSNNKRECLSSMLLVLQLGSIEPKIASAKVLESIAIDAESKLAIAETEGLLSVLLNLITPETDSNLLEASLSCLTAISPPKRIKTKLVHLQAVKSLTKLLTDSNATVSIIEKVLKLLETVSTCKDGRTEICEDAACTTAIVQRLLKVSNSATEHAVTILWSVCYLFRDQKAQDVVNRNNGLTKILLLMQSNCSPAVRQMAKDLLKIFRVNSKSCLSSYDTKTTHIMPF